MPCRQLDIDPVEGYAAAMMNLVVNTNQAAFDMAVNHLRSLPHRAERYDINGSYLGCSYLGDKCAVGILIDEWDGKKNAGTVIGLVDCYRLNVGDVSLDLLSALQWTHDHPNNWTEDGFIGEDWLEGIAEKFNLKIAVRA